MQAKKHSAPAAMASFLSPTYHCHPRTTVSQPKTWKKRHPTRLLSRPCRLGRCRLGRFLLDRYLLAEERTRAHRRVLLLNPVTHRLMRQINSVNRAPQPHPRKSRRPLADPFWGF